MASGAVDVAGPRGMYTPASTVTVLGTSRCGRIVVGSSPRLLNVSPAIAADASSSLSDGLSDSTSPSSGSTGGSP